MTTNTHESLSAAERALLLHFLDELSAYQSSAGCNDIELEHTPENVAMVHEVLKHTDYDEEEYYRTWQPERGSKFYAPCDDHGLLGHLRRKLSAREGLSVEQAREHAGRWADWKAWAVTRHALGQFDAEYEGPWDPHGEEGSERDRLESWVRARMAAVLSDSLAPRDDMVMAVATDLGLLHPSGLPLGVARDLCAQAGGWPL